MVFWRCQKDCRNGERWVTPEKFAEYREKEATRERKGTAEYREKVAARERERYAADSEYRKKKAAYIRDRYANDPLFATSVRLRNRTRSAFTRIAADKPAPTEELLGTDWQTLKGHIESRFLEGMSWENMSEWHIDHIVPLASAKTEEELAELCHYTNLQPLWASDNIRKGAKLPK